MARMALGFVADMGGGRFLCLSLWLTVWLTVFERVWCGGEVCDTTVFSFFVFFCFVGLEHWCACMCVEHRQASGWLLRYLFFLLCSWPRVGIGMDRCRSAPAPKTGSDSFEMALSAVGDCRVLLLCVYRG